MLTFPFAGKQEEVRSHISRQIFYLNCIHDTISEDSHLACDRLHSLFELCDVRAGGENTVKARCPR